MLAEIQGRSSGGNAHTIRRIRSERLPVSKAKRAV